MGFAQGLALGAQMRQQQERLKVDKQEAAIKEKLYGLQMRKLQFQMQEALQKQQLAQELQQGRQDAGAASSLLQDDDPLANPAWAQQQPGPGPGLFAEGLPRGESTPAPGGAFYSAADRAILHSPTPSTGIELDPESRAQLQRVLQRQRVSDKDFAKQFEPQQLAAGETLYDPLTRQAVAQTPSKRLMEMREDAQRRGQLVETMQPLLADLSAQQRAFANAALESYRTGGMDDEKLLKALDRLTGAGSIPATSMALAFLAAGSGPSAQQAQKALRLLPEKQLNMTASELAYRAEGSGPEAERAQRALDQLRRLRETGVSGSRRRGRREPPPSVDEGGAGAREDLPDPTYRGGTVEGRGRFGPQPTVKSFKRVN